MLIKATIEASSQCPLCGKMVIPNRREGIIKEGDFIICGRCRTLMLVERVTPSIKYCLPTESERKKLQQHPDFLRIALLGQGRLPV